MSKGTLGSNSNAALPKKKIVVPLKKKKEDDIFASFGIEAKPKFGATGGNTAGSVPTPAPSSSSSFYNSGLGVTNTSASSTTSVPAPAASASNNGWDDMDDLLDLDDM